MTKVLKKAEIENVEEKGTKKEEVATTDVAPAVYEDTKNDIVITPVAEQIEEVLDDVVNTQAAAIKLVKKVLKKVANKKLKIKKAAKKLVKELTKKA